MLKKNILFLVVVIYLITALLGYQIGWSVFQYDELRLLQLPLALCALFILIDPSQNNGQYFPLKIT